MGWSADYTTITGTLMSGYQIIPENKEPEAAGDMANKVYSIKRTGLGTIVLTTNNGMEYVYKVMIRIRYKHNDESQRLANEILFDTLCETFASNASFENWLSEPSIEKLTNKYSIAQMELLYGQDTNT